MQTKAYDALMALAREQRRANESEAQSFSRLAQSPDGHALMRKHQEAQNPGAYTHNVSPGSAPVEKSAPANTAWNGLVAGVMQIEKCSLGKALEIILKSPSGQMAYRDQVRKERLASGCYTEADMTFLDSVEAVHKYRRESQDIAKADESEWSKLVEAARKKYPTKTLSEIYDMVRASNPESWWSYKSPAPGDPSSGELSGRPAPKYTPTAGTPDRTGSSGANQRGPEFSVEEMSPPTPTYKSAEAQTAINNFRYLVELLKVASDKAGKHWSYQRCIDVLSKCDSARDYMQAAVSAG
jgi:hypothetical protein